MFPVLGWCFFVRCSVDSQSLFWCVPRSCHCVHLVVGLNPRRLYHRKLKWSYLSLTVKSSISTSFKMTSMTWNWQNRSGISFFWMEDLWITFDLWRSPWIMVLPWLSWDVLHTSSTFSSHLSFSLSLLLFFFFYISSPSYKPGPGKLDYHGYSIFQILSSFGRLRVEQSEALSTCRTASLITAPSRYARRAGVLCITDGWLAGSGDWDYPIALLLSKL